MVTVAIIILGLIPIVIFVLLVRSSRQASAAEPHADPYEPPYEETGEEPYSAPRDDPPTY